MRAGRLLSLLLTLQTRGRVSAQALADEFEVSVRTIYRDMDELSAAGAPVYAERGRDGGFQLLDGWRTRLTGLTDQEAEALFLGGLSGPAAQMGFSGVVSTLQLKLLAALPPDRQAAAQKLSDRFHLDPIGWYRDADEADHLPALAQAVWRRRRIAVTYESWKGEIARALEPLGLILKSGVWYLAALQSGCARREPRIYRVSNVRSLVVPEDVFERPIDFSLGEWWEAASRRFESERFTDQARVRLSPLGLKRLARLDARQAAFVAGALPGPDGWFEVTVPIESISHAAVTFLGLGAEAEVLKPIQLRVALHDVHRRAAAING